MKQRLPSNCQLNPNSLSKASSPGQAGLKLAVVKGLPLISDLPASIFPSAGTIGKLPHLVYATFGIKPTVSCMLGKNSTN